MALPLRYVALFVLIGTLATPASAQTVRKTCPGGKRPGISGCVDATPQLRLTETAAQKQPAPKPVPRPDPAFSAERAKPTPLERQSRALLVQELKRLEEMLKKTPEASPDFPIILRRLADGYAELETIAERERAKAQAAADDAARATREAPAPKRKLMRGTGTVL